MAAVPTQLGTLVPQASNSAQTYWSMLSKGDLAELIDQTKFRSFGGKPAWNPAGAIRERWNTELLPILENILADPGNYERVFGNRSKHPCVAYHLYMIGEQMRWQNAQPTIVMICMKNRIAKRIIHLLKSIESFKALNLGFGFLAHTGKVSFHAGDAKSGSLSKKPRTLSGSKVVVSSFPFPESPQWSQATLGGLVLLDGVFYGLTVAHAFYPDDLTEDETDTCSISSGTEEMSELDDNETWSSEGSQTNERTVDSEASQAYAVYLESPVMALSSVPDSLDSLTFVGTLTPARSSLIATAIDVFGPPERKWLSREMDWALVRIEAPHFRAPNEIHTPDGRILRPEAPYLGDAPPKDKVLAIAGVSGLYESKCSDTMCGIMIPGSKAVQHAWTLDSYSCPGDCGTWIVNADNGDLYGTIVAFCEELSITYVLPIMNTWESIRSCHPMGNLALATTSNSGSSVNGNGPEINSPAELLGSALHEASCQDDEKVVQLLLDRGADVNASGGLYGSALQEAASGGHEKVVQLLLKRGADDNIRRW